MTTLNSNLTLDGTFTFDQVHKKKNITVTAVGEENELIMDSIFYKNSNSKDNFDIYYHGSDGSDTLTYANSTNDQHTSDKHITNVNVSVADSDDYELFLSGGLEKRMGYDDWEGETGYNSIDSLEVFTRDVEFFNLTYRDDSVDLTGLASGGYTFSLGKGNDSYIGSNGADTVDGGDGNDTISGSHGNNSLNGGAGEDTITGGTGVDTIRGGNDDDLLTGGGSYDTFIFDGNDGQDTITDYNHDTIYLEGASAGEFDIASDNDNTYISFGLTDITLEGSVFDEDDFEISYDSNGAYLDVPTSSSDTVICTYMFERGYIPAEVYKWDGVYGQRLGTEVLAGYHAWAIPLVEHVLKRSEIATQIVRPMACAWAQEMAHRCDPVNHPKGSRMGRAILAVGVPLCRAISRVSRNALVSAAS